MNDCIQVLTSKTPDHMKWLGGSASWSLNPIRAEETSLIVCFNYSKEEPTQNRPFLIGSIGGIEESPEWDPATQTARRYLVRFSKVWEIPAQVGAKMPNWRDLALGRNPVRYGTLDELLTNDVSLTDLTEINIEDWKQSLPEGYQPPKKAQRPNVIAMGRGGIVVSPRTDDTNPGISVEEAKRQLGLRYGLDTDSIEITMKF